MSSHLNPWFVYPAAAQPCSGKDLFPFQQPCFYLLQFGFKLFGCIIAAGYFHLPQTKPAINRICSL